jgi:hypothetical protein
MTKLKLLVVLIQKEAIKLVSWHPLKPILAFCTGNSTLYLWSQDGASCVPVPLGKQYILITNC